MARTHLSKRRSTPKHYRPPGKKKEGNASKFITRTKAVRYLQTDLATFRRLCILKGVFPRVPKKKLEGNHKTYYYMKDILFISHDPLLSTFRDMKTHGKKVKKSLSKNNKALVERLLNRKPSYTLDRLVKERYPTFIDALRDLDDCLTMVHLFAALPAVERESIDVKRIHNCRRLSHEWQAYISRTYSLRRTFISVKGIYYEATVEGQRLTWLTPHDRRQVIPDDVDFRVMLTFLEFYETLLAFVNFKLYHSINVSYPPILDPKLEALAAELYSLSRYIATGLKVSAVELHDGKTDVENLDKSLPKEKEESELRLAQLQKQLPLNEPGALMQLMEDASYEQEEGKDTRECKNLFKNLKFFLSPEAPRESLLFIIPAFGGSVSWDGDGSPFKETDQSITHQIVDRVTQCHIYLSREYIQPQWIYDCVNARILLPTEDYFISRQLPPHLSPFVDDEAEGYLPDYGKKIKLLQSAARKESLSVLDVDNQYIDDPNNLLSEAAADRVKANETAEKKRRMAQLQDKYHEELSNEMQGITYSTYLSGKKETLGAIDEDNQTNSAVEQTDKEMADMSRLMMSRKKRGVYEAIEMRRLLCSSRGLSILISICTGFIATYEFFPLGKNRLANNARRHALIFSRVGRSCEKIILRK